MTTQNKPFLHKKKPDVKKSAPSNPTPKSEVVVEGKPTVKITYRFFAAYHTARIHPAGEGKLSDVSHALNGLPVLFGKIKDGKLEPFTKQAHRAPSGKLISGKSFKGVFLPLTDDDNKLIAECNAKLANKKASAKEKSEAQKKLASIDQPLHDDHQGRRVLVHEMPLKITADPGTIIGLCINVDTKSKFRNYPLWQVPVGEHDIVVDVFETYGTTIGLNDKAEKIHTNEEGTKEKPHPVDYYRAFLTGDIWMRSTPPFTEADVDALKPDTATEAMKTALKKIYRAEFEKTGSDFAVEIPRKADEEDAATTKLYWTRHENSNCIDNIKTLNLEQDVPKRIHPAAYAAAAKAAHEAGVTTVKFTSSWRPMLGSMPHRMGLGLDIKYLIADKEEHWLNRDGLKSKNLKDKNKDGIVDDTRGHHNLTVEEQQAYNDWKDAEAEVGKLKKAVDIAKANEVDKAKELVIAAKTKDPEKIAEAEKELEKARDDGDAAKKALEKQIEKRDANKKTWERQVGKHEPSMVGNYRRFLLHEKIVTEVLDPWYLSYVRSGKMLMPNDQDDHHDKNASMHRNHLHISIADPEIN